MWFFADEDRMLQHTVRHFAQTELAPRIDTFDTQETFNRDAFGRMGELALLGLLVAEEDGGTGLGRRRSDRRRGGDRGCRRIDCPLLCRPLDSLRESDCPERERGAETEIPAEASLGRVGRRNGL